MSLRLSILFLALITVASISCKQRSSDAVTGIIQVVIDQEVRPIAQAQIKLIPKAPIDGAKRVDEQPEARSTSAASIRPTTPASSRSWRCHRTRPSRSTAC